MKSAITVATIAIATIVNRSGWVALRNVDGLDPVTALAGLTAMRRIVAADSGHCDAQIEEKAHSGTNRKCKPETTPLVDAASPYHSLTWISRSSKNVIG